MVEFVYEGHARVEGNNRFIVTIPINIVREMGLKRNEHVRLTIKKVE